MKIFNGVLFVSLITLSLAAFMVTTGVIPVAVAEDLDCGTCHENHTIHPYPEEEETIVCEVCHGEPDPNISVEENHQKIFKPEMEALVDSELCFTCHTK